MGPIAAFFLTYIARNYGFRCSLKLGQFCKIVKSIKKFECQRTLHFDLLKFNLKFRRASIGFSKLDSCFIQKEVYFPSPVLLQTQTG